MENNKIGYITTTYKLQLYNRHREWLEKTKELYNEVVAFYYAVLKQEEEALKLTNHLLMREMEILTIGTKEMKTAGENIKYPITDFPKLPLYFRRAAINCAISLRRSYEKNLQRCIEKQLPLPSEVSRFQSSPVYYKGMYREFTEKSIELKVFTGEKWTWVRYLYTGRKIPEDAQCLSPTMKLEKKNVYLHIPVKQKVEDIRTVQERMKTEKQIVSVYFSGNDSMAVCVKLNLLGECKDTYYIKGGIQRKAKIKKILQRADYVRYQCKGDNSKYYQEVEQVNTQYAHLVSKKIIDYCLENRIKIIAVPNYEQSIDFRKMRYMKTNEYEWIGRKIIRLLKYKAFANGILVSTVRPYHITDTCSRCGEIIQRYNDGYRPAEKYYGGQLYVCPNGHRGNSAWNAARNIGLHFLQYYN